MRSYKKLKEGTLDRTVTSRFVIAVIDGPRGDRVMCR